jgi:hypothetical protein
MCVCVALLPISLYFVELKTVNLLLDCVVHFIHFFVGLQIF